MKPRPPENGQLQATSKDGQTFTFDYSCEEDTHIVGTGYQTKPKWSFLIVIEEDVFQFDVVDEDDRMRVEMMTRNGCERYKAKGIPEAFIRLTHEIFKVPVVSSKRTATQTAQNQVVQAEEQHSADATKVWKRLVANGEASWNEALGRYVYPSAQ